MKTLTLTIIVLLGLSCKAHKDAKSNTPSNDGSLIGIVHVNENNCPVYLAIDQTNNPGVVLPFQKAYPLNLKDGMKKKGLKVRFTYTSSKAMQPEGCGAEVVIQLETITVIP